MVEVTQEDRDAWSAFVNCESDRYFGNRTKMYKQLEVLARHRTTALAAKEAELAAKDVHLKAALEMAENYHKAQIEQRQRADKAEAEDAELRAKVEKLREALNAAPLIASTEHPHTFRCRQDAWLRDVFTPTLAETQPDETGRGVSGPPDRGEETANATATAPDLSGTQP